MTGNGSSIFSGMPVPVTNVFLDVSTGWRSPARFDIFPVIFIFQEKTFAVA